MSQVPNISTESGISKDYLLAFGSLDNFLRRIDKDEPPRLKHLSKRAFLQRRIQKYKEYFNEIESNQLIIEQNTEAIQKLDIIVDQLNKMREQGNIDYAKLSQLWKEINDIINGKKAKHKTSDKQ
jgi:hypothetical protein